MVKTFRIQQSGNQGDNQGAWLGQSDANSCGYFLIHNAHYHIDIPNYEGSPEAVFEAVNRLRRQEGQEPLLRSVNLPSPDLARYFTSKGFVVSQLSNPILDLGAIDNALSKRDFDLAYLSSNRHYTGIVNRGDLVFLDSLTSGPRVISPIDARKRMLASLGKEENGRYNILGLVKKLGKDFRVL